MRRTTLLNLHKFKLTDIFAGNKVLILTIFFFLMGVFISVVLRGNNQTVSALGSKIYEIYRQQHFELEFLSVFSNTVIFNFLILCVCFTVGTSMFGVLLSPLICFFYGGIFGSLASYMCVTYLLKGLLFAEGTDAATVYVSSISRLKTISLRVLYGACTVISSPGLSFLISVFSSVNELIGLSMVYIFIKV